MKIVCEKCESSFKFEAVKDMKCCPVCGEPFESISSNEEIVMKDLEHPDLYFYAIDSEDKYENKDLRDVWCQCTSCKEVNTISYSKFDIIKSDYLKLKNDLELECEGCGKPFTNTVVPKRPEGWRELNRWEIELENIPKCPTCSSTNIKKISATSKVASVAVWGLLSRKVHKQWHCNVCGSEW